MANRILITGAGGYIGAMLCDQFSQRADVERIIALDKAPMPEWARANPNIRWIAADTAGASWQQIVAAERPDLVIHAAWQIRDMYGQDALQREWNVAGSDAVIDFALSRPTVKRLAYFSTVASYGAQSGNTIEHRFREEDEFRASDLRYAEEKRIVEAHLAEKFAIAQARGSEAAVVVLRPAAISGPRGRRRRGHVGLQSALAGHMKGGLVHRLISLLLSVVPVTPKWCRQFIHEDDIVDIAALTAFGDLKAAHNVFNVCPPGDVVRGADMAKAFGKRAIRVHPQLIRLAFFLVWHGSRGRIATSRGTWESYCYPVAVDGSKLTNEYGYRYRMDSLDALTRNEGRYAALTQP
jgi:nucleoside-diphosphate-sugar epimerase